MGSDEMSDSHTVRLSAMKHLEKCQTLGRDETLRKMSDSHKFTMGSDETLF